jgi:hypothetical protein
VGEVYHQDLAAVGLVYPQDLAAAAVAAAFPADPPHGSPAIHMAMRRQAAIHTAMLPRPAIPTAACKRRVIATVEAGEEVIDTVVVAETGTAGEEEVAVVTDMAAVMTGLVVATAQTATAVKAAMAAAGIDTAPEEDEAVTATAEAGAGADTDKMTMATEMPSSAAPRTVTPSKRPVLADRRLHTASKPAAAAMAPHTGIQAMASQVRATKTGS